MGMNKKDKNVVKGLMALAVFLGLSAVVLDQALKAAGDPLRLVGAMASCYVAGQFLVRFYKQYLTPSYDFKAAGGWAIVTGCTGGLGQEYAHRLAKRGMNVLLISRSEKKLKALQAKLIEEYGVLVEYLAFDFAKCTAANAKKFYGSTLPAKLAAAPIQGEVGLLVNNVGVGDEAPLFVEELPLQDADDMIKVNCGATVQMSRALLPLMSDRRKGAIINVSSGSCAQPTAFLSTYSATKSFIAQFSRSIGREYAALGVKVLCINPYYISGTGLYPASKPSLNAPAAYRVVEGSFQALGKHEISHSYYFHAIIGCITGGFMEDSVMQLITAALVKPMGLNGSMLMIQQSARKRSEKKNPELFANLKAQREEVLAKLGRR